MAILGFSFTKMNVDKQKSAEGPVRINNNASIKNIVETDLSLGLDSKKGLVFDFEFTCSYEPGVGKMVFGGNVIFVDEEKKMKEISELWKKKKSVSGEVMAPILNHVLSRCTIQALFLSREFNLPPPLQLPKVQQGKTQLSDAKVVKAKK